MTVLETRDDTQTRSDSLMSIAPFALGFFAGMVTGIVGLYFLLRLSDEGIENIDKQKRAKGLSYRVVDRGPDTRTLKRKEDADNVVLRK
jgi:hypothetical protein